MGPRSCERGNLHRDSCDENCSPSLQWGRARASAEITLPTPPLPTSPNGFNGAALVRARKCSVVCGRRLQSGCFNGAALVRARKCATEWAVVLHPRRASMGPRSCERGNVVQHVLHVCGQEGFNGAALVRARKFVSSREWSRASRSFNGAALVRARKYFVARTRIRPFSGLQWGRARASAEIPWPWSVQVQANRRFNGAARVRARESQRCKEVGCLM